MVMLGIWALYQALNTSSVLAKTLYAYTIYSAALTPVILAAFYSRRANAQGAVSAIAAQFEKLVGKMGYSEVSHTLEFFGVCKSCRNS